MWKTKKVKISKVKVSKKELTILWCLLPRLVFFLIHRHNWRPYFPRLVLPTDAMLRYPVHTISLEWRKSWTEKEMILFKTFMSEVLSSPLRNGDTNMAGFKWCAA